MAEAAVTPAGVAEFGYRMKRGKGKGQKHELGNSVAFCNLVRFITGVQQENLDFTPVIRVNNPDALGHGKPGNSAEAASGIDKTGYSRRKRLYGNA